MYISLAGVQESSRIIYNFFISLLTPVSLELQNGIQSKSSSLLFHQVSLEGERQDPPTLLWVSDMDSSRPHTSRPSHKSGLSCLLRFPLVLVLVPPRHRVPHVLKVEVVHPHDVSLRAQSGRPGGPIETEDTE